MSKANLSHYGNTQFTITHTDGSVSGPAVFAPPSNRYENQNNPVPGGIPGSSTQPLNGFPTYFRTTQQPVRSTFHSFEQLGVPAGARVYGFSVFGIDVTEDMDLVGLTDVPLNTDHIITDSADFFGSVSSLFVPGDYAIVGIAKRLVSQEEIEPSIFDVELEFNVENLSVDKLAQNVQVTDNLSEAFAGAESVTVLSTDIGGFTPPAVAYDGADQINLLSGADSMNPGERAVIRLNIRVDIGTSDGVYENTAIVTTAIAPGEDVLSTDLSDDGTEPDSNGDGRPDGEDEDDPTVILLGTNQGAVTVEKDAGKTQVGPGDFVPYKILVKNNTELDIPNVEVQDTPPAGFSFVEDSALLIRQGPDKEFNTEDDVEEVLTPRGTTTKIFGPFTLAAGESANISYMLRVGAGVSSGIYDNLAVPMLSNDPVGPQSIFSVEVVRDSFLDQDTIIGTVFHDRDGDGYQDDVNATNVKLNLQGVGQFLRLEDARFVLAHDQSVSGDFDTGITVSEIAARDNETERADMHEVKLYIPLHKDVTEKDLSSGILSLESAEGTILTGQLIGPRRELSKERALGQGVNAQQLDYVTSLVETDAGQALFIRVFNDAINESGIPGVRLATVEGLLIETDQYGRYHLVDVDYIDRGRGSQFIVKLDSRTLPKGSVITTENPRVMRITSSVLNRINFGVHLPDPEIPVTEVEVHTPAFTRFEDEYRVKRKPFAYDGDLDPIRFDSGMIDLSDTTASQIKSMVNYLQDKENVRIKATGHTDPVPLKPYLALIYGDNQGLSEARANAVADSIRENHILDGIPVETDGKAFSQPIATNSTEEGRAINRRVEVEVVFDKVAKHWVKVPIQVPAKTEIENRPLFDGGRVWATEDPGVNDPRLDLELDNQFVIDDRLGMKHVLRFSTYSNYKHFIDRWELTVYPPGDLRLTRGQIVATGSGRDLGNPIKIYDLDRLGKIKSGDVLAYKLRAYDQQGRWDETSLKQIEAFTEEESNGNHLLQGERLIGNNSLAIQSIPVRGSRVRLMGAHVSDQFQLKLNGEKLQADGEGNFVTEQHLPIGSHAMELQYQDKNGTEWKRDLDVDVEGNYLFMVGLANLTLGGNDPGGAIETIGDGEQFGGDSFVNARGAFYLKGKIKGKYLITAQLDTREDEFKHWDDQLKRKDRTELFRRLDPDRYYPVYGDDSTTYSDVDSQGALYVRVDWDKSRAIWGNFNSDITANEFAHYNRTLYGAQLVYRSTDLTSAGEHKNHISGFVSEAQSAAAHNEFSATGGSLYYLQQTDIVVGSEKIWIEIREEHASQVAERYPLRAGLDYEIDYFQGRIILTQPLSQIARRVNPSIIHDAPLQGNKVVMLVDYEYVPADLSFDNPVAGIRGKTWIGDQVGVGATVIDEQRDGADYSLQGVDLTWQATESSYVKGEFAQSESNQSNSRFTSNDGGLTFNALATQSEPGREGDAAGLEAYLDFADLFSDSQDGGLTLWHKQRDAGFSSSRDDRAIETVDQGVRVGWNATENVRLSFESKTFEQVDIDEKSSHRAQIDADVTERLSLGVELQRSDRRVTGADDEDALLLGGQVNYKLTQQTRIYSKAQTVLDQSDAYQDNDSFTLGVSSDINERLTLGGEVVTGDRGRGLLVEARYTLSEKAKLDVAAGFGEGIDSQVTSSYLLDNGLNVYGSYTRANIDNNETKSTYTVGQRKKFTNGLAVFAENQLSDVDSQTGVAHVFGVDYGLNEYLTMSASVQKSVIDYDEQEVARDAATLGLRYKRSNIRTSSKLEYRQDRAGEDITQWLTTNALEWKQNRDIRWMGNLNYSVSTNDDTNVKEAKFTETSVGFAYRPALNDRFNMLSRITYLYDLPALSQDTVRTAERSWIVAAEADYAVTPRWGLGGKIANKTGEIRRQRDRGPWLDSTTWFYAGRLRYHLIRDWDALGEYRWLQVKEDETVKSGALLALYKHIGDHIKLGGGFNFTDFNDDLTNLDYDNRGWFIDIVAKY